MIFLVKYMGVFWDNRCRVFLKTLLSDDYLFSEYSKAARDAFLRKVEHVDGYWDDLRPT